MRLRLRRAAPDAGPAPADAPEGWRRPRHAGRGTAIGNLGGVRRALVDPAGLVALDGAGWSLDWWIGAEDRWHLPAEEVAVRQRLVSSAPVVETRLRVPSGDAVHRAYAARTLAGDDVVVVEVVNESKIPFAVALSVRPFTATGAGRVDELAVSGTEVAVDGTPVVVLPRAAGRLALSTAAAGNAAEVVLSGAAEAGGAGEVRCVDGLAHGTLLFPLAHTATLRVLLPLSADAVAVPADAPGATDVAGGWSRQVARGARVEVPDRRLRDAVAASTRHLLLAAPSPAVAEGLDGLGFHDEARTALDEATAGAATAPQPGQLLHALARHHDLAAAGAVPGRWVEAVGLLVARLGQPADPADADAGHAALPAVARLLDDAGEARAADDARDLHGRRAPAEPAGPDLATLLRDASGTWTWPGPAGPHDASCNARLVGLVRALLVGEGDASLALSPEVPAAWLGQGWEVHDLPTRHGRLSFAVRWHGERPALLWQLDDGPSGARVRLTCPGLDPSWSTDEPAGEALLAAVALPEAAPRRGITMPVAIEPLHRRST